MFIFPCEGKFVHFIERATDSACPLSPPSLLPSAHPVPPVHPN